GAGAAAGGAGLLMDDGRWTMGPCLRGSSVVVLFPSVDRSHMRTFISALAGLSLAIAPLSAQALHYQRQPGLEIAHYVFGITLTDASDDIQGETTVTTRFTRDGLASFWLDLSTASNGKGM